MRKDLQLKLNTDTGGGEGSEHKAKLINVPKSFDDDCRFMVGMLNVIDCGMIYYTS